MPVHEQDNVRAALEWAMATGADDAAHRLVVSAAQHSLERGLLDEAVEWLDRVRARPWSADVALARGWVLVSASALANLQNDFKAGLSLGEMAHTFITEHALQELCPQVFMAMGIATSVAVDFREGERLMERAALAARERGFSRVAAYAGMQLAGLRLANDPAGALVAAEAAAAEERDAAAEERVEALATLACTRLVNGDAQGAISVLDEMDRIAGDLRFEAWGGFEANVARAVVMAAAGRAPEARTELRDALEWIRPLHIPLAETGYLVAFAGVEAFGGDPRLALVLLGAARRRFDDERSWRAPIVSALYVQSVARARALVPEDVAKQARAEGFALVGDEVFALID
jgi:hypothetical protein